MKATRVVWSGVLAAGVLAALPAAVTAAPGVGITVVLNGGGHGRDRGGYGRDRGGYGRDMRDAFRYGFERGRAEGAERGYRDERRGRGDFRRDSWYRDGDRGYRGGMGSRSEYAAGYRQGFEAAYRSACLSARSGERGRDSRYGYDRRDDDRYRSEQGYDRDDERYRDDRRYNGQDWRR